MILEHEPDRPTLGRGLSAGLGQHLAVEQDGSRLQPLQAGRQAKQRTLAAARRAEQAGDLASPGGQRHVVQHGVFAVAVADLIEFEGHSGRVYARAGVASVPGTAP